MATTIVTGVDPSQTALVAAEKAAALADGMAAKLYVICGYSVSMSETMQTLQRTNNPSTYHQLVTRQAEQAQGTADAVAEALRGMFPELEIFASAVEGAPADVLTSEADRLDAEIIVVGNKGVQGPARLLGSIARTVASETNCDLYIVNTLQRKG